MPVIWNYEYFLRLHCQLQYFLIILGGVQNKNFSGKSEGGDPIPGKFANLILAKLSGA